MFVDVLRLTNTHEPIALEQWGEVVSQLQALRRDDHWLRVELDCGELLFPIDSLETKTLEEDLKKLMGQVIGILRTDSVDRPVTVRAVERGAA